MSEKSTEKLDRYGEEQTVVRNEDGNWIGESGYVYIREEKATRVSTKAFIVGTVGGALLMALFIVLFGVSGI